jgi:hypothetical protein
VRVRVRVRVHVGVGVGVGVGTSVGVGMGVVCSLFSAIAWGALPTVFRTNAHITQNNVLVRCSAACSLTQR